MRRRVACGLAMLGSVAMAGEKAPTTRAEAMSYLGAALPKATAANPKYLTKADGTLSQWLTRQVAFAHDGAAVEVTMRETYTQTKDGKTVEGRHEARFALADVTVAPFSEPGDVTPSGEASQGLLISCARPGCIAATWGEKPSASDKTDIYIQDAATRDRIVAAFRRLQQP